MNHFLRTLKEQTTQKHLFLKIIIKYQIIVVRTILHVLFKIQCKKIYLGDIKIFRIVVCHWIKLPAIAYLTCVNVARFIQRFTNLNIIAAVTEVYVTKTTFKIF